MYIVPRLLVVDDEEVVCQSCIRIFGDQGYHVEARTDSREGLQLALDPEQDFKAILLDVRMPELDGIDFLQELKRINPDVPVIVITGFSESLSETEAKRLGAVGYIPKPFTPDEITKAVLRSTLNFRVLPHGPSGDAADHSENHSETMIVSDSEEFDGYFFYGDAWAKIESPDLVATGVFLPRGKGEQIIDVELPEIGQRVYRGLPLARLTVFGQPPRTIPSPITGEVMAVSTCLVGQTPEDWNDPCHAGWIATICPDRLHEELRRSETRNVLLATAQKQRGHVQQKLLAKLGCQTRLVENYSQIACTLHRESIDVLIFDADSYGRQGPEMIGHLHQSHPKLKIVVVAGAFSAYETEYRSQKIFYYAIEPFGDWEIIDILDAVFHAAVIPAATPSASSPLDQFAGIHTINRKGNHIALYPCGFLLERNRGVGRYLIEALLADGYPVETEFAFQPKASKDIWRDISHTDCVILLASENLGAFPGTITPKEVRCIGTSDSVTQVITLAIQPEVNQMGLHFDDRVAESLAQVIFQELKSR